MDVVVQVDRRPRLGETIVGDDLDYVLGGKGANQAISAARLGAPVNMIGKVGVDSFGDELRQRLESEDLSLEYVDRADAAPTGTALITVDEDSENSIVLIPGCNMAVDESDVSSVSFEDGDIAVSQFEIPQSTVRAFFQTARDEGGTTVLNPAPAGSFEEPILPLVDYLVVNETEALFFNDENRNLPLTEDEVVETCKELRTHDEQVIIVTLGDEGLLAHAPDETIAIDAHSVDPVDTTGAGDAFVGAFATAIGEGAELEEALEFANAAGAAATTVLGASSSLPDRDAVRSLRAKQ